MRVTTFSRLFLLLACAIVCSSPLVGADELRPPSADYRVPGNLPFLYDYDEALRQTRQDGRPLFVYFAAKTFAQLDLRYFADPEVEELLSRMNRVYVTHAARPELFPRFQIHMSNPTFLVLNEKEQNLHRRSGWTKPRYVARYLQKALENHDRYQQGEEWVERSEPRGEEVLAFAAPVDGRVSGMAIHDGTLWCLQERANSRFLFGLDPMDGSVRRRLRSPIRLAAGLTADDDHLYLVPYGWPREPIVKLDPRTGEVVARLETGSKERSSAAYAIAADAEYLWVHRIREAIYKVDRKTGAILNKVKIHSDRYWISGGMGMEHDGTHLLLTADLREHGVDWSSPGIPGVLRVDPETGRLLDFEPTAGPMGGLVLFGTELLLADGERFGHDERGHRTRLYPDQVLIHLHAP